MSITSLLLGIWFFSGVVYRGAELPRPNPDLQLQMMFLNQDQMKVHYSRLGESGFCESLSDYSYDSEKRSLHTKVVSLNPDNDQSCTRDPDMRVGSEASTEAYVEANKLYLKLRLGEEDLTMIWERQ